MSTPAPTDIIRAYDAIQPRQLFNTFKAQLPYDRIGEVWRAMDPGRSDTALNVKTCLWSWIPGRYLIAPRGTYVHLLDFPGYRVSLMCGGLYDGWRRRAKTHRWGIFLPAALIFRLMPADFPALLEIVAGTIERIASGELRLPEVSAQEIRGLSRRDKTGAPTVLDRSGARDDGPTERADGAETLGRAAAGATGRRSVPNAERVTLFPEVPKGRRRSPPPLRFLRVSSIPGNLPETF